MSAPYPANLFISEIDYKSWILSGGPNVITALHGIGIEKFEFPGVLLGFPSVQSALKAAGRIHSELGGGMNVKGLPPMVVSYECDVKLLPTFAYGLETGTILLTSEAARFVSGEPIELRGGPRIPRENRDPQETKIFPTTSANLGWALPTLSYEPRNTPYFQGNKLPELLGSFTQKKEKDFQWVIKGFYWSFLFGIPMIGLLVAYSYISSHVIQTPMKENEKQVLDLTLPDVSEDEKNAMLGTVPTVVSGYGDILIEVEPKDAQVFLNNKLIGKKSPLKLERQETVNTYSLMIRKKGYETYSKIFNIDPDQVTTLKVQLAKK